MAALVAVIVGGGVAQAAPNVDLFFVDAAMTIPDRERLHAYQRAHEREQPAADLLAKLRAPLGLADCHRETSVEQSHLLCWEGDAEVVKTAAALAAGLREVGATDVDPKCGELRFETRRIALCTVGADLEGQRFAAFLGYNPQITPVGAPPQGVFVSGGLGELSVEMISRVPSRAIPIPVPNS